MKKAVFVACACMMFLGVILTGCEDDETDSDNLWDEFFGPNLEDLKPEPYHVRVTVAVKVNVKLLKRTLLGFAEAEFKARTVLIEMNNAGGDKFVFTCSTTEGGSTQQVSQTFNVTEGGYVEAIALLQGGQTEGGTNIQDSKRYDWETIWLAAGEESGKFAWFNAEFNLIDIVTEP